MRRDGKFGSIARDAKALRHAFGLEDGTKIIVSSVGKDAYLERLWRDHQIHGVPDLLASLNVQAVTVPNFSFFEDAPLVHALYNRNRMLRLAERFSAGGLSIVPHLNALTESHWRFWEDYLRSQPQLTCVCKEFQTGLKPAQRREAAFDRLVRLQDAVGRDLHPVLLGGRALLPRLKEHFKSYSIVDATPFLKTHKRKGLRRDQVEEFSWVSRRSLRGAPLDSQLETCIKEYEDRLRMRSLPKSCGHPELSLTGFMGHHVRLLPPQKPVTDLPLFHAGSKCSIINNIRMQNGQEQDSQLLQNRGELTNPELAASALRT
jgi:hypothetical protein